VDPSLQDTVPETDADTAENAGLMSRPLTDDDMGLPSDAGFTATDAQKALGFTGGAVDGDFGPNSRKRLLDFQRRAGLPLTGDFNDPATRAALMDPESTDPRKVVPIDTSPDLTTSGNIDMNKVTEYLKSTVQNPLKAAGIIGTIRQELGNGPIRTEGMGYRLGKKATATSPATGAYAIFLDPDVDAALANLTPAEQARAKTNVPMDALGRSIMDIKYDGGHNYRGRGLVQITHKDMYKKVGDKIGVDLVANPELVNDPEYAVPAAIALLEIKDYFGKATTKNNLRSMINPGQTDAKRDARWKYVEAALAEIRAN
jgi:peptidoglycan hydrolase-like protein with peptidoglycan-binding domain